MAKNILNFNLESTDENLTPRAGAIVLGEYLKGVGLESFCNCNLPLSNSNNAYSPFEFIYPLILMLHCGGRVLEDIRDIRCDEALKKTLKLDSVPTPSGVIKWLKRTGLLGIFGIEKINKSLIKRYIKKIDNDELILDIDATFIEAHKSTAKYSYKKAPGYMPMTGHINGGYCISTEFRDGNIAPADTNLEFIIKCIKQLPKGKKIKRLRADSASYQANIFNYCDTNDVLYAIGGQLDSATLKLIRKLDDSDFKQLLGQDRQSVAEVIHTMNHTDNAFRLIVVKKTVTPVLPGIWEMLSIDKKLD